MRKIRALIIHQPYARPGAYYAKEVDAFLTHAQSRFLIVKPEGAKSYALYARRCGANVSSLLPPKCTKRTDVAAFIEHAERLLDLSLLDELPAITLETEAFPFPENERDRERLRKIRTDAIAFVHPLLATQS